MTSDHDAAVLLMKGVAECLQIMPTAHNYQILMGPATRHTLLNYFAATNHVLYSDLLQLRLGAFPVKVVCWSTLLPPAIVLCPTNSYA